MIEGAGLSLRIVLGALNNGITPARARVCTEYVGPRNLFHDSSALGDEHVVEAICNFAFCQSFVFFWAGRCSWRTVPTAACESQLMRRRRLCMSRGQPRLLEAGREEGPRPATMHPGAGVSLVDGARTMVCSAQVRGSIFILLSRRLWFGSDYCQKPCDANPEEASGSVLPNVGLTAAFAAPQA